MCFVTFIPSRFAFRSFVLSWFVLVCGLVCTSRWCPACAEETPELRVAIGNIPVTRDVPANTAAILKAVDAAVAGNADILLTPEGSLSGYTHEFEQQQVEEGLTRILKRATAGGLALALGTCFRETDGHVYNELRFYDARGEFLGFHSKILVCGYGDPLQGEINHYAVAPLRTFTIKGITVGGLICNDLWATPGYTPMPDTQLCRQLAQMGARIIFHAVNAGKSDKPWNQAVYPAYHESNLRLHAWESKVWIATAGNAAPLDLPAQAPSGLLNPEGNWVEKAPPTGEHVIIQTIRIPEQVAAR